MKQIHIDNALRGFSDRIDHLSEKCKEEPSRPIFEAKLRMVRADLDEFRQRYVDKRGQWQ